MTNLDHQPRRWTIAHYQPNDDTRVPEEDWRTTAAAHLRDRVRPEGYELDYESLTVSEPQPVVLVENGLGYRNAAPGERPDGYVSEWSAQGLHPHVDEPAVDPVHRDVGLAVFAVPETMTAQGGSLACRHSYGGPVTVTALSAEDKPVGYLVALDIDDDAVQVELLPGATRLVVTPDTQETP